MNKKLVNFKKDANTQKNSNSSVQKRQTAKNKLMTKFNISEEEAEKALKVIEINVKTNSHKEELNQNNEISHQNDGKSKKSYYKQNSDNIKVHSYSQNVQKNSGINKESNFSQINKKDIVDVTEKRLNESSYNRQGGLEVDDILSDLIPDYNQQVSIELNHVSLTFEVSNEKVDTIKEYFIRTLKRDNSQKFIIPALKDISLKIYKGEKVGIIGYNGAGKSTLLNVITGIYTPNEGSVKTYGNISPLLSLGAGFDYNYSGRKNILLNGAVLGYDKKFLESKTDEIIEFTELGDFIDIPIKNYSSGMLAKLGFAIATAVNPDILIIDEILGVGDVNFRKKSSDKIKSLMDGKTTVLLVSHSIPQIRELCDKAIWIDNGTLREMGDVNKVCDHYLKDAEKASHEQLANIQFK